MLIEIFYSILGILFILLCVTHFVFGTDEDLKHARNFFLTLFVLFIAWLSISEIKFHCFSCSYYDDTYRTWEIQENQKGNLIYQNSELKSICNSFDYTDLDEFKKVQSFPVGTKIRCFARKRISLGIVYTDNNLHASYQLPKGKSEKDIIGNL